MRRQVLVLALLGFSPRRVSTHEGWSIDARSKEAAVSVAVVFALGATVGLARAEQPSGSDPAGDTSAAEAGTLPAAPSEAAPSSSPEAKVAGAVVAAPPPASPCLSRHLQRRVPPGSPGLSLTVGVGEAANRWAVTLYGFVEADLIYDTTRSYNDSIGQRAGGTQRNL